MTPPFDLPPPGPAGGGDKNGARRTVVLLAVAFAARLAFVFAVDAVADAERGGPFNYPDSLSYLAHARAIRERLTLEVEGLRADRPPLYPLFLALLFSVAGETRWAWGTAQAALGALSCLFVAQIGRILFSARAGRFAGWTFALWPHHVAYTPLALAETLFLFLFLAHAAFLFTADRPGRATAAGILGGLAALARPGILLFPPLVFAVAAIARPPRRRWAVALAAFLLTLAPWTVRNRLVLGAWAPVATRLGHDLCEGNGPEATGGPVSDRIRWPAGDAVLSEAARDAARRRRALAYMVERPARTLHLTVVKVARLWNVLPNDPRHRRPLFSAILAVTFGPVAALAVWGLVRFPPDKTVWILALLVYLTATHALFVGSIRYRLPAEPFLILLAAGAADALPRRRAREPTR